MSETKATLPATPIASPPPARVTAASSHPPPPYSALCASTLNGYCPIPTPAPLSPPEPQPFSHLAPFLLPMIGHIANKKEVRKALHRIEKQEKKEQKWEEKVRKRDDKLERWAIKDGVWMGKARW